VYQTFLKKIFSFQKKYFLLAALIFSLLLITQQSCNTTSPSPTRDVELSVSDVSCTEAWLNLTVNNLTSNTKVQLVRNSSVVNTFDITTRDTTLYDDSLSPNKTYNYQVIELQNGNTTAKSEMITAKTMDTTSNNFTWQTFTFGGSAGSCSLNDVDIINDTLAYAVGKIFVNDSTWQPDPNIFNAVQWNGNKWKLKRIMVNYNGNTINPPLEGIYTFSTTDIWLVGSFPIHGDGKTWTLYQLQDMGLSVSVSKAWGSISSNMYFVGTHGSIAHYNNGTWQKLESGTTTNINDIWGYIDANTGQSVELCAVSFVSDVGDYKILKINGNKVDSLKWNMQRGIHSVWTKTGFPIYAAGDGVFTNSSGQWKEENTLPLYYEESIRGNDLNDIFVCGDYGLFAHFNGVRWKVYNNLAINGIYFALAVKGDLVVAVGTDNNSAIIVMGKRN
jgi:hypothetical protein